MVDCGVCLKVTGSSVRTHPYFIGECGGAMQGATCPDCKAPIGGSSHTLVVGNSAATEFGEGKSAWPGMNGTAAPVAAPQRQPIAATVARAPAARMTIAQVLALRREHRQRVAAAAAAAPVVVGPPLITAAPLPARAPRPPRQPQQQQPQPAIRGRVAAVAVFAAFVRPQPTAVAQPAPAPPVTVIAPVVAAPIIAPPPPPIAPQVDPQAIAAVVAAGELIRQQAAVREERAIIAEQDREYEDAVKVDMKNGISSHTMMNCMDVIVVSMS